MVRRTCVKVRRSDFTFSHFETALADRTCGVRAGDGVQQITSVRVVRRSAKLPAWATGAVAVVVRRRCCYLCIPSDGHC